MKNYELISEYDIIVNEFKEFHTVGKILLYKKPSVVYIFKGQADFLLNGKHIYAHEGDLVYIAPNTKYYSVWNGSPDIKWYSINFSFLGHYSFLEYQFQILKNYPSELFENMYQNFEKKTFLSLSYFYKLLDDIYDKMVVTHSKCNAVISDAIKFIEKNYDKPIEIDELAKLCHCSNTYVHVMFKKNTGVSPILYKHNVVVQHALYLLSNTDMSIEEISTTLGFSSSNYFRKVFEKEIGHSPKHFRNKKMGKNVNDGHIQFL